MCIVVRVGYGSGIHAIIENITFETSLGLLGEPDVDIDVDGGIANVDLPVDIDGPVNTSDGGSLLDQSMHDNCPLIDNIGIPCETRRSESCSWLSYLLLIRARRKDDEEGPNRI